MKNKFNKIILSTSLGLMVVLPAMANSTKMSLSAAVQDVLVVQIERISDEKVVSKDDFQSGPTDPASDEILTFGVVDARGVSAGTLASTNNSLPTPSLQRVVLDSSRNVYDVSSPPNFIAGALYYIKNGYQIRTVRTPGPTGEVVTDVDVYNEGDIATFVALTGTNPLTQGGPAVTATSLRAAGSGAAAFNSLKTSVANNAPFAIDLGIYVPNATTVGAHTTTVTFTGT